MTEHDEAARLLRLDEDELLTELGTILSGQPTRDGTDPNARENGRNWFAVNKAQLRRLVCGNPAARSLQADTGGVTVLAEILGELLGVNAAFAAAAYLLKRGLHQLCPDSPDGP
ncbi:hypothetical protein I5Q34_25400 [Streptomyces sp. AV19]|uniref:hypothetical protein n=1 Tax=Streptomyces sp. AV19 TaxID=2793068 RepID=UPI0018FE3081|nr:hypothetical protein [Streptomyces sp. AV19]MBH1937566.1 hypothetical protein [Streptomyces sp. AV19]MDG4532984.1 hypothetical protein [Streptomyces sp. AV19]